MRQTLGFIIRRHCLAALLLAATVMAGSPTAVRAQQIIVIVNGEPITALDVEHRSKLVQLSSRKVPPRQEIIDELIAEKLKLREAKRYGLEPTPAEVDRSYAVIASRMRLEPKQLSEMLTKAGSSGETLKTRLKADLGWTQLVRGRYNSTLQVGERDILAALETKKDAKDKDVVGYEYVMRPVLFITGHNPTDAVVDARKREAEALRQRFQNCNEGISFARQLRDVAVREPIVRNSVDLAPQLRSILDGVQVGHLTPPEVTKNGVEMFAICEKRATSESLGKREAREEVFSKRFQERAKHYLKELRRSAMIEYR